jgi:hypothetical protein
MRVSGYSRTGLSSSYRLTGRCPLPSRNRKEMLPCAVLPSGRPSSPRDRSPSTRRLPLGEALALALIRHGWFCILAHQRTRTHSSYSPGETAGEKAGSSGAAHTGGARPPATTCRRGRLHTYVGAHRSVVCSHGGSSSRPRPRAHRGGRRCSATTPAQGEVTRTTWHTSRRLEACHAVTSGAGEPQDPPANLISSVLI